VLSEVTRLTKSPTHRSANVRRPLWSIAGWRPDQRLFSGRSPAYPVRTTSALSVGSVTPAASETGQGFGHTVTLRFPAGISHVRRLLIRPSLQRSHRRKPAPLGRQLLWTGIRHRLLRRCPCRPAGQPTAVADARYARPAIGGTSPSALPAGMPSASHYIGASLRTHDVILASRKGDVILASREGEVNLASRKGW
jgi:hypothetical protein